MKIKSSLPSDLKYQALVVQNAAVEAGLDFFDVVFELLDASDVNGVASYGGFPVRYPSWRFGMEYERLEKGYRWGFSKIYELVINNDPTYAYLVKSNSMLEQKLVMAHVYGHADFFKNNVWFAPTQRNMLDVMGNHATRIRRYIDAFGQEKVEQFLDKVLSLETLIDPYLPLRQLSRTVIDRAGHEPHSERARRSLEALTSGAGTAPPAPSRSAPPAGVPGLPPGSLPTYDVLGFLAEHAPLEPWQRNVVRIVRREAYYFSPQRMTRVMNEGWASFWHSRLLTRSLLEPSEIVDFADCHSGATSAGPQQLNPYKFGIELYRHAEARGLDIFRLRRLHNDVSLIDKLVDEEFAEHSYFFRDPPQRMVPGMPGLAGGDPARGRPDPQAAGGRPGGNGGHGGHGRHGARSTDWRAIKGRLLQELAWGGLPQIELADCGGPDSTLVLVHRHDGRDLQLAQASHTLKNLAQLWGGPARLLTMEENQGRLLHCDGDEVKSMDTGEAEGMCRSEPPEPRAGGGSRQAG